MPDINKLIERMRYWCDEVSLGYSQDDRWDIRPDGNADCSSLVIHALKEAGFDTGSAGWTGNLSSNLTERGWARLPNDGNPQPGDILLNDRDHVAVYLGAGTLAQASISENGGINGAPGDQTGGETNTAPYYDYPWDCYLRYTGQPTQGDDMVSEQEMLHIAALTNSYKYGNDPNTVWNYLTGTFNVLQGVTKQIAQLQAALTAQNTAVQALCGSLGADPADIGRIVQDAVKAKLDSIDITVSSAPKQEG